MGIHARQYCSLKDSVVPQLFGIEGEDIYYFDKTNKHEGRFCKFSSSGIETLFEIGEIQGIVTRDNKFYSIEIAGNTIVKRFNYLGEVEKSLHLDGIFFDICSDNTGNILCLGYKDDTTIIEIFNNNGFCISSFSPSNILFASSMLVNGDDIFLSGFDRKNVFKIIKLNYIGNIQREWTVKIDARDRIIGKINLYKNHMILHVMGKSASIATLELDTGYLKEIRPSGLRLSNINDINLYNDKIYILDGRRIYTVTVDDIIHNAAGKRIAIPDFDLSIISYQYVMYTNELKKQFKAGIKLTALICSIIFLFLYLNNIVFQEMNMESLAFLFCFCWILNLIIASAKSLLCFFDKAKRIEQLLIAHSNDMLGFIPKHIFMGFTFFSCVLALIPLNLPCVLMGFMLSFSLALLTEIAARKQISDKEEDIIIELLDEEDQRFRTYMKAITDKLREVNRDTVCIEMVTSDKDPVITAEKWALSRKTIIGDSINIISRGNKLITILDLSKRDIKYSRLSIMMDYICYIKRYVNISNIEINDDIKDAL